MNTQWAKCALIRAIKTIAQTAIATIGTSYVISDVDWRVVASASVLAGILSLLTSVAGLPEVEENDDYEDLDADLRGDGSFGFSEEDCDEDEDGGYFDE